MKISGGDGPRGKMIQDFEAFEKKREKLEAKRENKRKPQAQKLCKSAAMKGGSQ